MDGVKEDLNGKVFNKNPMDNLLPLVLAAIIGFVVLVVFYILKKRGSSRHDFLLIGLSESGKTSIFMQLIHNKMSSTFTSITENVGEYKSGRMAAKLVDIPGHYRVREKYFDQYKRFAKGIIFVIDSATVQKEIRDVADVLYGILVDSATTSCSVLILCNKQDQTMAKGVQVIKTILEKELNLLRDTRSRKLQSTSEDDENKNSFLGVNGKDFEFSQLPQNIQFYECSAKNNELNNVSDWLDRML